MVVRNIKGNMPICDIYGCSNRPGAQQGISFYKLPGIITKQGEGETTQKLTEERRRLWKAAL